MICAGNPSIYQKRRHRYPINAVYNENVVGMVACQRSTRKTVSLYAMPELILSRGSYCCRRLPFWPSLFFTSTEPEFLCARQSSYPNTLSLAQSSPETVPVRKTHRVRHTPLPNVCGRLCMYRKTGRTFWPVVIIEFADIGAKRDRYYRHS